MKTDPKSTLQLAFQTLDKFSIPGVGTFQRSYFPAHIDRDSKIIRPPGERFSFESGDGYVDRLEAFVAKSGEKVLSGVGEIKSWLVRELKKGGSLIFPGVGKLELRQGKEVSFTAESDAPSQRGSFFGLPAVSYTLGAAAGSAKPEKKKPESKIALAKTESEKPAPKKPAEPQPAVTPAVTPPVNETPATPPPAEPDPVITDPEPPRRKRSKAWIWIILILLLAGLGTTGIVMREQVREQLVSWGWISGDTEDPQPDEPDGTVTDSTEVTDGTDGEENPDGDGNEDWRDVEEPTFDPTEKVGSLAESGVYYLVVASAKEPANIKQIRREMGGKILRPRYQGNFHRVYTYRSANKDEVIAKMVETKGKYPNSWIYWMGM